MCGSIDFPKLKPPVSVDRRAQSRPRETDLNATICNRIIQHSHECSLCKWKFFPTFRLLGFILFFHTGGSSKEWRTSISKFYGLNPRTAMARVLEKPIDPNVAKIVARYFHLINLVYKKTVDDNFGKPSVKHTANGRRSFYVFEKRAIQGLCSNLMNNDSPVYLINLNDGNRVQMTEKQIDESLEHFYQMDFTSAVNELKSILNSFSICKKCILGTDEDAFYFDYNNARFLLKSQQSGGPRSKRSKSPTTYPKQDGRKLRKI